MNAGNLIFLVLIVGGAAAMFSMHRGGHAHGGASGGGHGGMGGGCGGGHAHGNDPQDEATQDASHEHGQKPLLGPPGTAGNTPAPPPAQGRRHRGC